MKNTTSATQFSPPAIVNRPVGGMWKKLNASALSSAVASAEPDAPQRRDDQHREQVDDAEREHRRDAAQRVDQQRGERDAERRRHDPDEQRRAAREHGLSPRPLRGLDDQAQLVGLLVDA